VYTRRAARADFSGRLRVEVVVGKGLSSDWATLPFPQPAALRYLGTAARFPIQS
jgi:hypothetical protein